MIFKISREYDRYFFRRLKIILSRDQESLQRLILNPRLHQIINLGILTSFYQVAILFELQQPGKLNCFLPIYQESLQRLILNPRLHQIINYKLGILISFYQVAILFELQQPGKLNCFLPTYQVVGYPNINSLYKLVTLKPSILLSVT